MELSPWLAVAAGARDTWTPESVCSTQGTLCDLTSNVGIKSNTDKTETAGQKQQTHGSSKESHFYSKCLAIAVHALYK